MDWPQVTWDFGPLHTQDWEHVTITLQALLLVEKAEPVQVRFTLCLRVQWSIYMWMEDGCKVYIKSYMALNGSCFMVTWIIFKNHLLEVGLTQIQETMALRALTTIGLFYLIMCEDTHEEELIEIAFGWGHDHIWLHTTLEGPWPYYMIVEVCWDGLWTLSFGLSQCHGHGSWLVCEVALRTWNLRTWNPVWIGPNFLTPGKWRWRSHGPKLLRECLATAFGWFPLKRVGYRWLSHASSIIRVGEVLGFKSHIQRYVLFHQLNNHNNKTRDFFNEEVFVMDWTPSFVPSLV